MTYGLPCVIVPVLSKIIVSMLVSFSNASPDLIRMPNSAPFPVPTITATGVASPKAHGQDMTKIATAIRKANEKSPSKKNQTTNAIKDNAITIGTNTEEI